MIMQVFVHAGDTCILSVDMPKCEHALKCVDGSIHNAGAWYQLCGLVTATADIDKALSLSVSYKKDELETRHSAYNSNLSWSDINVCGAKQAV